MATITLGARDFERPVTTNDIVLAKVDTEALCAEASTRQERVES